MVCEVAVRKKCWVRGWFGRHCMTCGTHTTANVTAAVFGFNPLLSGSFLKWHGSCECTICSLLEESPLPCPAGGATGTDTQIVILTLALSFNFFFFVFFWRASRPLCECAGHAGPPGVPLLWRPWKLVVLFCQLLDITHQLHLPDARLLPIRTASSVCVRLCASAHVCVYIYIKRE